MPDANLCPWQRVKASGDSEIGEEEDFEQMIEVSKCQTMRAWEQLELWQTLASLSLTSRVTASVPKHFIRCQTRTTVGTNICWHCAVILLEIMIVMFIFMSNLRWSDTVYIYMDSDITLITPLKLGSHLCVFYDFKTAQTLSMSLGLICRNVRMNSNGCMQEDSFRVLCHGSIWNSRQWKSYEKYDHFKSPPIPNCNCSHAVLFPWALCQALIYSHGYTC